MPGYENFDQYGDHLTQTRDIVIDEWDTLNDETYGARPIIIVVYEKKVAPLTPVKNPDGDSGDHILIYENSVVERRVDGPYEFVDRIYSYTFDLRCIREKGREGQGWYDVGRERMTQMRNGLRNILMTKWKTWFGYDSELVITSTNDLSDKENFLFRHIFQVQITRHALPLVTNEAIG